jgi:hypothetical protein
LDYEEKEVKPYKPHELKALFQAASEGEQEQNFANQSTLALYA